MSSTVILQNLSGDLYSMFEKKKFGVELSNEEKDLLEKFKNSRLVRALIDPSVDFRVEGYVPPRVEIEIAFSIVSGRPSINFDQMTLSEMTHFVYTVLSCGQELYRRFESNVV